MFKPLSIYIGLRYTRAKRRNHFISFISLISMLGIALGVWALIVVISVMNGFEIELRDRILGMAAHATISGLDGQVVQWEKAVDIVDENPRVLGSAPYIHAEAMLTHGQAVRGSIIRGVLPEFEPKVSEVSEKMSSGSISDLTPGSYNIILGSELARALGVLVGDKVTLVAPTARVTPAGIMPRLRRFTVSGVFEVNMHEYDSALALIAMEDAAKLFRLKDMVSGIRLKLDNMMDAPRISRSLANILPGEYWVKDWTQQHSNFFKAVKTEKTVMFVILTLVVAVAAFNIVSTLIMVVTDKEADIAILRTLGFSPASIMRIFMVQGTLVGVVGTLTGAVLGIITALNIKTIIPTIESLFQVEFMPADVYYISELPSHLETYDVFTIVGISMLLSVIATLYPAWRASRVQPSEALRYE